jgi:hypothetical protein
LIGGKRKDESNTMDSCNHFHHWATGGDGPV